MSNADKNSEVVVSANDLKKTFVSGLRQKKVRAVQRSTFELRKNEVVGLVGPNGAGKTTTMKMLTGLVKPDSGTAVMFGLDSRDPKSRSRLGYLPENPYFYEHLTGVELLRFYGNLFGFSGSELNDRIVNLVEKVGLAHAAKRAIKNYSKGMRQRIGIAQALINNPDLIILDEPQSGLDPIGRREIRDIILEQKANGKTVLFSSHILPDVEAVCDRIIIMKEGRTVELEDSDWCDLLSQKGMILNLKPTGDIAELKAKIISQTQLLRPGCTVEANIDGGYLSIHVIENDLLQALIKFAANNGIEVASVTHKEVDFEALLMNVLDAPSVDDRNPESEHI